MNDTEFKILEIFQKEPGKEHSTSEIAFKIEPGLAEEDDAAQELHFPDKEKIRGFRLKKAQLHRKTLYYLSKLVKNNVLKETRKTAKGEKFFELALQEGEELILDKYGRRSITIQRPTAPSIPIEGFEQEGIIKRLETSTWIERLNSIIIECDLIETLRELESLVTNSFSIINDVIAFDSFESFFEDYSVEQLELFMKRMNLKCSDYGKKICCIIDIARIRDADVFTEIMHSYSRLKSKNIQFVFEVEPKDIQTKSMLFYELINFFSRNVQRLYFKNKNIQKAPYLIGRAGPYTFSEREWELYEKELKGKVMGLIVSQATVMVDVEKFFKSKGKSISKFRNLISNIAYSFLETNSVQRTQSSKYFESVEKFDNFTKKNLLRFSKNYVRFWNYGWKNKNVDPEIMINLMKNSKEMIDTFCNYEDTIYKSCGMPTRFRVAFSFVFEELVESDFTQPVYERFYIKDIKDFYDEKVKKLVSEKERLFEIFDGGDLITFYRKGKASPDEVIREILFVLNTFRLPFFRYDFRAAQDVHKSLTKFID